MERRPFVDLEEDFVRIVAATVFSTVTTVDERGRPRNRILHPVFVVRDGAPLGWALTGRTPTKSRHLAANPHVACSYWIPRTTPCSSTACELTGRVWHAT